MTARTTGFACFSRDVASATMRWTARMTSAVEYSRRAPRRTASAAPARAATSTFEAEFRALGERADRGARFLPLGRGMQSLPVERAAAVQARQAQQGGRIHKTFQRLEHHGHLLGRVAEQHEVASGI